MPDSFGSKETGHVDINDIDLLQPVFFATLLTQTAVIVGDKGSLWLELTRYRESMTFLLPDRL